MVSVSKSTLVENIWKTFYDRIKDQVTSVDITGPLTIVVQNYVASFPDSLLNYKQNYPIIVIQTPSLSTEPLTFGKTKLTGTIGIRVYTTQAESADKFLSKIIDAIETFKPDLAGVNLKNIELDSTDSDKFERGAIKVHYRKATFSFVFTYTKNSGY